MRPILKSASVALSLALMPGLAAPGLASDFGAFADGDTFRVGGLDLRLGNTEDRWGSTRGGAIALDRNTFIFGREDTYETVTTRSGLEEAGTGATIGVGMGFSF